MSLAGLFNARWPGVALFDLDGTLVDSAPDLAAAVDRTLEQLGRKPAGLEQVRQWVGHGSPILMRRALAGKADWEPARAADDALFDDALALFYANYREFNGQHAVVYPGVKACLEFLSERNCPMAVVTNKPEQFVGPLLKQLGLDYHFKLVIGGDTLETRKPDPGPLLHAMGALKGSRGTTVMIGDSAADVTAAQAAGIPCVAVTYGYNFGRRVHALGADAVVDSLSELL
ncbi:MULTISPECIES: phosphoglycolate phosphatase [Marinobacter]|uniref:Phosphoglycolate phosphatase n=1 Tax=Marinobacter xiaoshiensis TaxID=3073652 RepID=A0ABU2HJ68_9GAMM|nr:MULTISPECIES: phosphoglycolate phosphatase [unclassified Marinobacter]MBK1873100.1 phosphoglycolate phosphatase [Marinobacter sp. 1-3A]MBK1886335.1 phosphoglycolate phosphatase [Marinobacter sp. DY40_1A1]MDS1311067.1 phosphoglycolate phosphatase [Marinobacter sp. F60267]